ncbi:hypothetical protein GJ496_007268 [Pomphorhynchus laevis]|nr:hypothetical protein GJ496_007268 [Pomphorhynchus laevis]
MDGQSNNPPNCSSYSNDAVERVKLSDQDQLSVVPLTDPLTNDDYHQDKVVKSAESKSTIKDTSDDWCLPTDFSCELDAYFSNCNELDKSFSVNVHEPTKVGDGISSYFIYQIDVQSSTLFCNEVAISSRISVHRRFSDFLVLHSKLAQKYLHQGRIVPNPPGKDPIGTALFKFQSKDKVSNDFLNRRRFALKRYLIKINRHPVLRLDDEFKHFLRSPSSYQGSSSLHRASIAISPPSTPPSSSILSVNSSSGNLMSSASGSFRRVIAAIQNGVSKVSQKVDEPDMHFDELHQNVDATLSWLKKLAYAFENLATFRKKCSLTYENLKKTTQSISNCEQSSSLCRSLTHLSQCLGKVYRTYYIQSEIDTFVLAELAEDYVGLYGVIKQVLDQRIQILMSWRAAEDSLKDKRNAKLKLELNGDKDKIPQTELEIIEYEVKVDRYKENFDNVSAMIKSEMSRFDLYRVNDFQEAFISYFKQLRKFYSTLQSYWNDLIPKMEQ